MLNKPLIIVLIIITSSFRIAYSIENSTDLYKRGASLAVDGKLDEAITAFKKVIEVSPYYTLGHYGLGKAYLYMPGKLDDAIWHLRLSVKLDRGLSRGYFYLGMAYFFAERLPDAASSFARAYRLDDTLIESLFNLGVIYDRMKNSYKAKFYYNQYIQMKNRAEEERIF